MPQNLTTTILPSPQSKRTVSYRNRSVQFGSGYQQDVPDGINSEIETWDLVYDLLNASECATIEATLRAAKSWDYINWTAPGRTAKTYKMTPDGYTVTQLALTYNIAFKLVQVY